MRLSVEIESGEMKTDRGKRACPVKPNKMRRKRVGEKQKTVSGETVF